MVSCWRCLAIFCAVICIAGWITALVLVDHKFWVIMSPILAVIAVTLVICPVLDLYWPLAVKNFFDATKADVKSCIEAKKAPADDDNGV